MRLTACHNFTSIRLALLGTLACSGPAFAQQQAAASHTQTIDPLNEIVVTASKRTESIQNVPMSVSAFGELAIERNAFNSVQDYGTRIPNFAFAAAGESRSSKQTSFAIRGISGAGTTGLYIDDSPLPDSLDPAVVELERIEVLRGPQGTLYGARSMGGTVRLITKQPDLNEFAGHLSADLSSTSGGGTNHSIEGVVNLPVASDTFALRVLGYTRYDAGFLDRAPLPESPQPFAVNENFNNQRRSGGQITGLLSLLDGALTVTPRFAYEKTERDGRSQADIEAGNDVNYRLFDIDERSGGEWKLATLTVGYTTDYGRFVSATSYFDHASFDTEDGSEILNAIFEQSPPVPGVLRAHDDDEVFSQEFRFSSSFDGPLQLTTGLYFQDSKTSTAFPPSPMPPISDNLYTLDLQQKVKEAALFAEANYDLTDRLTLIAGLRYFDNEVTFSQLQGGLFGDQVPYEGEQQQSGVTPKVGVQYHLTDDRMIYANAGKGYRVGGVNGFAAGACAQGLSDIGISADDAASYKSDSVRSYELGAKTRWLDRTLALNAAAFRIDWDDLQQTLGLGDCGYFAVVNIGAARSQGMELEVAWSPSPIVSFSLGLGYTDAEIVDNGGLTGNGAAVGSPVQNVPEWTANSGVDLDFDIGNIPAFVHADYAFVDRSFNNRNEPRIRPSYAIANLRGGITIGDWELALFVRNLTDEAANLADVPPMVIEYPGRPRIQVNQPRTLGVQAKVSF